MKFILTTFNLFSEVSRYPLSGNERKWKVFAKLFFLHAKSKFSSNYGRRVSCNVNGFIIYAFDYPTLIGLYKEIFLEKIYHFKSSTDSPFVIDCGAHIGMSVLYFKSIYPYSKIWAFEPNPNSFAMLQRNIEANKLKDVEIFNCALSDKDGVQNFYVPFMKGSLNGSLNQSVVASESIRAKTARLSQLIKDLKIDFIKIDVEGEEKRIIDDLLKADVLLNANELVIECHRDDFSRLPSFILDCKENGFYHSFVATDEAKPDSIVRFKRISK